MLFESMSVKGKLYLLLTLFLIGFVAFGTIAVTTLNTLKINGHLYNDIVMGKDLVADILPPPEYIIESYLVVQELSTQTDPSLISTSIDKLSQLKNDYGVRHQVWVNNLPQGEMRTEMIEKSYEPANQFFDIVFAQYIPAVQKGDTTTVIGLRDGILKQLYSQHRTAIDNVVTMANEYNLNTENEARTTEMQSYTILLVVAILTILLSFGFGLFMVSSILKPIRDLTASGKKIANGDLTAEMPEIKSKDELRDLADTMNLLTGAVNFLKKEQQKKK
ncbi:MAG: HAMP domain-containing protein [archaeon]